MFTIETKNSASFSQESKNNLGQDYITVVGSPIGLLLALTYAEVIETLDDGYQQESKNTDTFSYETKNTS